MIKTILIFMVLMPSIVFAGTWCQWDGTEGTNCKTTDLAYIVVNDHKITISAENLNPRGWYELTTTQPTIGADQVKDAEVWEFSNDAISLTWTVRDLTAAEIDTRDAEPMTVNDYYQWKAIQIISGWTNQQLSDALPAELVDAYVARNRLENP